jgi:hypothetical protein
MKAESLLLPKAPKRQDSGRAHHDYAGSMDCSNGTNAQLHCSPTPSRFAVAHEP